MQISETNQNTATESPVDKLQSTVKRQRENAPARAKRWDRWINVVLGVAFVAMLAAAGTHAASGAPFAYELICAGILAGFAVFNAAVTRR